MCSLTSNTSRMSKDQWWTLLLASKRSEHKHPTPQTTTNKPPANAILSLSLYLILHYSHTVPNTTNHHHHHLEKRGLRSLRSNGRPLSLLPCAFILRRRWLPRPIPPPPPPPCGPRFLQGFAEISDAYRSTCIRRRPFRNRVPILEGMDSIEGGSWKEGRSTTRRPPVGSSITFSLGPI